MKGFRNNGYGLPVLLAIGLHAAIIAVGLLSVDFSSNNTLAPKKPPIVNATIIDVSQTIIGKREAEKQAALQRQATLTEKKKKAAEQKRKANDRRKALEEKKKKLAKAKAEKDKKLKKQALAKKQEQEKAKALEIKKETEKKRLAEEKDKALAQKKAQELEVQRKKEAQELEAQRKKEAAKVEAARIAEEERKRQEESAREAEKQQLAEEASSKAAAELAKQQAFEEAQMVQSISGLINSRVTAAWIRPPNARNGMITHLRIYFLPNGEVRDVEVTKSSGDALFDQRAADAVKKVRQIEELADVDSYIFERNFRQVDLIFNPQDLRN